jgi:esterase FrsA
MLIMNGADDYFVPRSETLVFTGRAKTDVHMLGECRHCAVLSGNGGKSRLPDVIELIADWLPNKIGLNAA